MFLMKKIQFTTSFTHETLGNVYSGKIATIPRAEANKYIKAGFAVEFEAQKPRIVYDPYNGMTPAQMKKILSEKQKKLVKLGKVENPTREQEDEMDTLEEEIRALMGVM